jgi:hypothetical protein
MELVNTIYCERQKGELCRLHALNACYGRKEISEKEFVDWGKRYDQEYSETGLPSSLQWDGVLGNQENLIAYILKQKSGLGVIYSPPGYTKKTLTIWGKNKISELVDPTLKRLFVFNRNHVWIYRYVKNTWISVDSIGGVKRIDLNDLVYNNDVGFMSILSTGGIKVSLINIRLRIRQTIQRLCNGTVNESKNRTYTRLDLTRMVIDELTARNGITAFELDLCTFYNFLFILHPNHISKETFEQFFTEYQQKPANMQNVITMLPALLHFICAFNVADLQPK